MNNLESKNNVYEEYEQRVETLLSYYSDVMHYLGVFDISSEDIEDAVQDTFIEAFTYIDKLRDESKLKFWLLKIAKRQGIKYVNKNIKRDMNEQPLAECLDIPETGETYFPDTQVNDLIKNINKEKLRKLISRLNDKEQTVLILYYAYGYKLKDIARIMKESDTNVRSISKRSKDKLKVMIEKEEKDLKP